MDNKIAFDPADLSGMLSLMDAYGNSSTVFPGENEHGEAVYLSIFPDKIVTTTEQENGWVRINIYNRDGTREETFDGKWR